MKTFDCVRITKSPIDDASKFVNTSSSIGAPLFVIHHYLKNLFLSFTTLHFKVLEESKYNSQVAALWKYYYILQTTTKRCGITKPSEWNH